MPTLRPACVQPCLQLKRSPRRIIDEGFFDRPLLEVASTEIYTRRLDNTRIQTTAVDDLLIALLGISGSARQ